MINYYSDSLNANQLMRCYEVAPMRVKQFLKAEIAFVLSEISPSDKVLDLGCGYGRVVVSLLEKAKKIVGIDISKENIDLAKKTLGNNKRCTFYTMNANDLKFDDNSFDAVICVQNGISAFNVDPVKLMGEAIRVAKKGGTVLFSSYSEKFWEPRLEWFRIQSEHKLIGEIDYKLTKNGVIICKDGFKAITYSGQRFLELAAEFKVWASIHEIDDSSVFCKVIVD